MKFTVEGLQLKLSIEFNFDSYQPNMIPNLCGTQVKYISFFKSGLYKKLIW